MLKVAISMACASILVGCSTFQPSHYTNYNTPNGNHVVASGRAADNAAFSNTSHNAMNSGSRVGPSMYGGYNPGNSYNFTDDITRTAGESFTGAIQNVILLRTIELTR